MPSNRERWDAFYAQPLNESEIGRFPKVAEKSRWAAFTDDELHLIWHALAAVIPTGEYWEPLADITAEISIEDDRRRQDGA